MGFVVNAIPHVAPEIWQLRPDFAALSIVIAGALNAASGPREAELLAPLMPVSGPGTQVGSRSLAATSQL